MNAKLKKEIQKLLNTKLPQSGRTMADHVVDERIVGGTIDEIAEQTGYLMGKLTTLDVEATPANPQAKIDQNISGAHDMIFNALVDETIRQLTQDRI